MHKSFLIICLLIGQPCEQAVFAADQKPSMFPESEQEAIMVVNAQGHEIILEEEEEFLVDDMVTTLGFMLARFNLGNNPGVRAPNP